MFDADQDYAEACNPDRYKILGKVLNHFCEGHRVLLRRIKSPFVCGGQVSCPDLVKAVLICSKTYEAASEWLEKPITIKDRIFSWSAAFKDAFKLRYVYEQSEALAEYISIAERLPKGIFRPLDDGKPKSVTHAPVALVFHSDLASHYGYSFSQFMNMPLRRATMERYRLLEIDGSIFWRPPWYGTPKKEETEAANG